MYIYKITNKITGKMYIGQTNNYKRRIQQHLNRAKNKHTELYNDIRKYGNDAFEFSIIDETNSDEELNKLEQYYINLYHTDVDGYNIKSGGNVMHVLEHKNHHKEVMRSDAVRKKISKSMKKYREEHEFTVEHRKHLSESMMGNHNFGTGDTRSIECYCIDENGKKHEFHNYKEAGLWWHRNYNPFGIKYNYATYRRKIVDCIHNGCCYFGRGNKQIKISNIKWYQQ